MKINFLIHKKDNQYNNKNIKNKNLNALNFKGFYCKEEIFEVKKLYNIPCPICGIEMINQKQMQAFIKEIGKAKGQDLVKLIEKYEKYFHEREKRIAQIIKYEASIDETKDVAQIIQEQYKKALQKTKKEQAKALSELEQFLKRQKQANFKQGEKIIQKHKQTLEKDEESLIERKELIKDLTIFFESDKINKPALRKILSKFPDIKTRFNFFNTFHDASNRKLGYILSSASLATCEHIKPKTKNGEDNSANYLAQCCECNSKRNYLDFSSWVKENKDFKINFERYLNEVSRNIAQKQLPKEYETYLEDIAQTIKNETNGKINFQTPKITPPPKEKEEKQIDINSFEKKLKKKKERLKKLSILFESLKTDKEFYFIVELDKSTKRKQDILKGIRKEQETREFQQEEIKKFQRKKAGYLRAVSEFENTKDAKEKEKLKSKIAKLESFLSQQSNKTLEKELQESEKRIEALEKKLQNIENRITFLESNIQPSQETKEKFKMINIEEKIDSLSKEITRYENIIEKYKAKKLTFEETANLLNQIN